MLELEHQVVAVILASSELELGTHLVLKMKRTTLTLFREGHNYPRKSQRERSSPIRLEEI